MPRTDRKGSYFSDDKPHRLQWLNDILVTYAVFHPEVGYAQGMNDVLSMILAVMDHEADAYWCFQNYLSTIQEDFMTKGMMEKLGMICLFVLQSICVSDSSVKHLKAAIPSALESCCFTVQKH